MLKHICDNESCNQQEEIICFCSTHLEALLEGEREVTREEIREEIKEENI